jgi:hypothetical protein
MVVYISVFDDPHVEEVVFDDLHVEEVLFLLACMMFLYIRGQNSLY